jgi:hypothetical protein
MKVLATFYCVFFLGFSLFAQMPVIDVNGNAITYLYGSRALKREGNVERQNGDFLRFTGASTVEWRVNVSKPGAYEISINAGVKPAAEGKPFKVDFGKASKTFHLIQTDGVWGFGSFERTQLKGTVKLHAGIQTVRLIIPPTAGEIKGFDFRGLEIIPEMSKTTIDADRKKAEKARASTEWLAKTGYGVMFHWTSQSVNPDGTKKPFSQAVADFNVNEFVNMVEATGAGYVIFTVGHAEPYCPAPLKNWEKYHPQHTTQRDLIMEMAEALTAKGIRLLCYFPTHVVAKYKKVDAATFEQINTEIFTEFGHRYGKKVSGYWFDGWYQCFEEYPTTSFQKFFEICKDGNPERIIALNTWIYPAVTEWQEYWAGETASPVALPHQGTIDRGPGKGLRYQSLLIMEPYWVQETASKPDPRFTANELATYISNCQRNGGAVTVNIGIYQNGSIGEKALATMKEVKALIRK